MLANPQLASRNCAHCLKYHYDEEKGEPYESRTGGPALRHAGCPAPCRTDRGCPKGTPENPVSLSRKNTLALEHYLACQAVGQFPDDPIVRRNATLFRGLIDAHEKKQRHEEAVMIGGLFNG